MNPVTWLVEHTGMSHEEIRTLAAITTISLGTGTLCGGVGGYFLHKILHRRDKKKKLDRDSLVAGTITVEKNIDGENYLCWQPSKEVFPLHIFFGEPDVEAKVKKAVARCEPGEPLLPCGDNWYIAMDRTRIHFRGVDSAAAIAVANGREDDTNKENMAFTLTTCVLGGITMPVAVQTSRMILEKCLSEKGYLSNLKTLHTIDGVILKVLKKMVEEYAKAKQEKNLDPMEETSGPNELLWLLNIRTMKIR